MGKPFRTIKWPFQYWSFLIWLLLLLLLMISHSDLFRSIQFLVDKFLCFVFGSISLIRIRIKESGFFQIFFSFNIIIVSLSLSLSFIPAFQYNQIFNSQFDHINSQPKKKTSIPDSENFQFIFPHSLYHCNECFMFTIFNFNQNSCFKHFQFTKFVFVG